MGAFISAADSSKLSKPAPKGASKPPGQRRRDFHKYVATRRSAQKGLGAAEGTGPSGEAGALARPRTSRRGRRPRAERTQKATVIIEHLAYDTLVDWFDSAIFTENQTKQDLSKMGDKLQHHIYDYALTDSKVEQAFAKQLDTSAEVAVYAKLPRGFFIPTPVGNYNPDWAIAFKDGTVKHVYFVAETKGSLSSLQLKGPELAKIECARKFFTTLNQKQTGEVTYDVVTDYGQLMQLVGVR